MYAGIQTNVIYILLGKKKTPPRIKNLVWVGLLPIVIPKAAVGLDSEVAAGGPGEVIFLMSTWLQEQVGLLGGVGAAEVLVDT